MPGKKRKLTSGKDYLKEAQDNLPLLDPRKSSWIPNKNDMVATFNNKHIVREQVNQPLPKKQKVSTIEKTKGGKRKRKRKRKTKRKTKRKRRRRKR